MNLTCLIYSGRSVLALLMGVRNLPSVAWGLLARPVFTVCLKGGYRFRVRRALDVVVLKEVILDREYQRMGPDIEPGWTVVDIGAAHGEFAIPAARRIGDGRVVAVEPAPDTVELLRENLLLNHAEHVELVQRAIGARSGSVILNLGERGAMMNSTTVSNATGCGIRVSMITLAELFESAHIAHCDYLKMDCEGGEYEILTAAPDSTLQRISRMVIEYHEGVTLPGHEDLV
jgi:FkbM family methyltransferase